MALQHQQGGWHGLQPDPRQQPFHCQHWQDFVWTPARLSAWLQTADAVNGSSEIAAWAGSMPAPPGYVYSQQQVPPHLRQLLLLLLQSAADTGHAQQLIWTPARLSEWLANNAKQQPSASTSVSADSAAYCWSPVVAQPVQLPRSGPLYMQRLPLVSSLAASKAQAALAAANNNSSSDMSGVSGHTQLCSLTTSNPSPSNPQVSACCAEQAQLQQAVQGEAVQDVTSPHKQQPQQASGLSPVPAPHNDSHQGGSQQLHMADADGVLPDHLCHTCAPLQTGCRGPCALSGPDDGSQQHSASGRQDMQLHQLPQPLQQRCSATATLPEPQPQQQPQVSPQRQGQRQEDAGGQLLQPQLQPLLAKLQQLQRLTGNQQAPEASCDDVPAQAARVAAQPSPPLPPKEASPCDYEAVEANPAWDAQALQAAAAAAARQLGLQQLAVPRAGTSTAAKAAIPNRHGCGDSSTSSTSTQAGAAAPQQHDKPGEAPGFGVLMLVHEKGVAAAEAWDAWERLHCGRCVVRVHLKQGVSTAGLPGAAWITNRQLPSSVCSKWGCVSLTAAILKAAADMLQQHPGLQHIAVVSGQDLPVAAVPRELRPGLSLFGRFQFGRAFDTAAQRVAAQLLQQQLGMSVVDSQAWGDALVFHHTWMVLDRQLLLALISKQEELLRVGAVLNERFMQPDAAVAADEFLLITAARRFGFVQQIVQKKLAPYMANLRRLHRQHKERSAAPPRKRADGSQQQAEGRQPLKQQRVHLALRQHGRVTDHQPAAGSSTMRPRSRSRRACSPALITAQPAPVAAAANADRHNSQSKNKQQVETSVASGSSSSSGTACRSNQLGLPARPQPAAPARHRRGPEGARRAPSQPGTGAAHEATGSGSCAYRSADVLGSFGAGSAPPSPGSPLFEGTQGVLLDCCPTLALFHPTHTRHPHEWRNFSECLLVDINSTRPGDHRFTLLQALGLAQPNAALFFRKVVPMHHQGPSQLLRALKLLWKNRALPPTVEELPEQ